MTRIMSLGVFEVSNSQVEGAHFSCLPSHRLCEARGKAAASSAEMQAIVREAAEPGRAGETVAEAITRAARRLGLSYSRARAHWYGLARSITLEEGDALREARIQLARQRAARLRAELAEIEIMERAYGANMAGGIKPADLGGREADRRRRVVPGSREAAA